MRASRGVKNNQATRKTETAAQAEHRKDLLFAIVAHERYIAA